MTPERELELRGELDDMEESLELAEKALVEVVDNPERAAEIARWALVRLAAMIADEDDPPIPLLQADHQIGLGL